MFFDLNVPIKKIIPRQNTGKKGKQAASEPTVNWVGTEIAVVEDRIDLLVHCKSTQCALKMY